MCCEKTPGIGIRLLVKAAVGKAFSQEDLAYKFSVWKKHVCQEPAVLVTGLGWRYENIYMFSFNELLVQVGCFSSKGFAWLVLMRDFRRIDLQIS